MGGPRRSFRELGPEEGTIQCLALPIVGEQILVPNTVVVEVFAADTVSPAVGGPEWLLGSVPWRGSVLPLVCMEAALGGTKVEARARSKVVVMKTLSANESLERYAVLIQRIPHQVLVADHTVTLKSPIVGTRPFVAADLQVEGEQAFIPDLDAVETALLDVVDQWRSIESRKDQ